MRARCLEQLEAAADASAGVRARHAGCSGDVAEVRDGASRDGCRQSGGADGADGAEASGGPAARAGSGGCSLLVLEVGPKVGRSR